MGIATGLVAGFTLTSSVLYLTLLQHKRNRVHQSHLLSQQALLMDSIINPRIVPSEDAPRLTGNRDNRQQQWKEWWNAEVEDAIKWCHAVQWDDLPSRIAYKINQLKSIEKKA